MKPKRPYTKRDTAFWARRTQKATMGDIARVDERIDRVLKRLEHHEEMINNLLKDDAAPATRTQPGDQNGVVRVPDFWTGVADNSAASRLRALRNSLNSVLYEMGVEA